MKKNRKKVFVGISGGVDSSVSAALLKKKGFEVIGVFIKTWQPDWIECTWKEERRDAIRVCAHLDIPFVELDLVKEYKNGVADYMIEEYKKGRTPNPDVMCNKEVKFGAFLDWALKNGADYVATGHYARINRKNNKYHLLRGVDLSKDQSYFLWMLKQKQLKHILFPIGGYKKGYVRSVARKYNLVTAEKKDSQGICFIGEIDMKDFLRHYIKEESGVVLDIDGNIIGEHNGSLFFTIGERHGFIINKKSIKDKPYYVVSKNIYENTITVSQNPENYYGDNANSILLNNIIDNQSILKCGTSIDVQIRYHGKVKKMKVLSYNKEYKEMKIFFENHNVALASGQSIVFYKDDICLGGGIIS